MKKRTFQQSLQVEAYVPEDTFGLTIGQHVKFMYNPYVDSYIDGKVIGWEKDGSVTLTDAGSGAVRSIRPNRIKVQKVKGNRKVWVPLL